MSITNLTHVYPTIPKNKNAVQSFQTYQQVLRFAMHLTNFMSIQRVDDNKVMNLCNRFWTLILGQSNNPFAQCGVNPGIVAGYRASCIAWQSGRLPISH